MILFQDEYIEFCDGKTIARSLFSDSGERYILKDAIAPHQEIYILPKKVVPESWEYEPRNGYRMALEAV